MKGVTKPVEQKTKKQREISFGILLGTLDASLFGNIMTGKGIVKAGIVCVSYGSEMGF